MKTNTFTYNKRLTMKKLTIAVITALLMLTACNQQDLVNSPEMPSNSSNELSLVKMPQPKDQTLQKTWTATATLDHEEGGTITLAKMYITSFNTVVSVYAKIEFPANYLNTAGSTTITMTIDDETASIVFSPPMVFDNKPTLDLLFTGLEVYNNQYYDFRYVASDGSTEEIDYIDLNVDQIPGLLHVIDAELPHFSRYGYLN
jgi:hypothetical protein